MVNTSLGIKERLDLLDGGIVGTTFQPYLTEGWIVYESSTRMKYAILEIEQEAIWAVNDNVLTTYSNENHLKNLFPTGLFAIPPVVTAYTTSIKEGFTFNNIPIYPTGKDYMGEFLTFMYLSNTANIADAPNRILHTITAIGF